MAYFIFLKYLRSLEEFRKNPCVQITPKSPCANFQSIGIFKNSIFITKEIFFNFRPNRPSGQPTHLAFWPRAAKQAEPAPQAVPPFPSSLPHQAGGAEASSSRAAAPWAPRCPSPTPWSDPNGRPLLNSVACIYSVINPPSSLCVTVPSWPAIEAATSASASLRPP
jgi:hypothetical protein